MILERKRGCLFVSSTIRLYIHTQEEKLLGGTSLMGSSQQGMRHGPEGIHDSDEDDWRVFRRLRLSGLMSTERNSFIL